jgi:hypothetical protein
MDIDRRPPFYGGIRLESVIQSNRVDGGCCQKLTYFRSRSRRLIALDHQWI